MKITHRTVERIYGNDRSETHYFDVSFNASEYQRARIIQKIENFKKDPGPEFCLSFEIKPIPSGFDVNTSQTIREYEMNKEGLIDSNIANNLIHPKEYICIPNVIMGNQKLTGVQKTEVSRLIMIREEIVKYINPLIEKNLKEHNEEKRFRRYLLIDILRKEHDKNERKIHNIIYPNGSCLCTLRESCDLCSQLR